MGCGRGEPLLSLITYILGYSTKLGAMICIGYICGRMQGLCSSPHCFPFYLSPNPCLPLLQFSDKNIYPETFAANPDFYDPVYSMENGVYKPGCGLDNVMISWGHDEVRHRVFIFTRHPIEFSFQYLYHVFKEQSTLPEEGLAMIRYHSFYPCVASIPSTPTSSDQASFLSPDGIVKAPTPI